MQQRRLIMSKANYNLRLDQDLKERAFSVFEGYGVTPSEAIRMFLTQVADTNVVPLSWDYQPKPNETTIAAIEEITNGGGTKHAKFADFVDGLQGR